MNEIVITIKKDRKVQHKTSVMSVNDLTSIYNIMNHFLMNNHTENDVIKEKGEILSSDTSVTEIVNSSDTISPSKEEKKTNTTEGFFILKCPECGKQKFFNSGTDCVFHCDCGYKRIMDSPIKIYGSCCNCDHNIGSYGRKNTFTLPGMDISHTIICSNCESPVDLQYNEKKNEWHTLS